jgi:hypothetical protein
MKRILTVCIAVAAIGCASASQRAFVAPSYDNIISTTEEHEANPPTHLIYIENHSTVPVRIFAIRLTDCDNVNVQCGVKQMNLRVDPGSKELAVRISPKSNSQGFHYRFGFSWRGDSSEANQVLSALSEAGDSSARVRLAAMQHADSLRRNETGRSYNELTPSDFSMVAPRVASVRAEPESLVIVPGQRTSIERIRLLLLDKQGTVLGQSRWFGWRVPNGAVQFEPPTTLIARRPGRSVMRLNLAEDAQKLLGSRMDEIEYPIIAAYPSDPHAPMFEGRAVDADTKKPLACAQVALEDSAQNEVTRARTTEFGTFVLNAPRPGTYRVRVETPGWAPVYGPSELAAPDADMQHEYVVHFAEQMLSFHNPRGTGDIEHARPTALSTLPPDAAASRSRKKADAPIVSGVTLGGSEAMPILGIVGRAPSGTAWMQFVVDSTGHVQPASITLPGDSVATRLTSVTSMLPRVRFSPARENGQPVCELVRMQVNFSARP